MLLGRATDRASLRGGRMSSERNHQPDGQVPDREEWFGRWSALHGGVDPRGSVWVRGWLSLMHVLAGPLARRGVSPDALTLLTVVPAAGVVATAAAGASWPLLGLVLVVISGVGDGLDGAVAAMTNRATSWGYVLDSLIDRLNEGLLLVALTMLGAPAELSGVTFATVLLLEYLRARSANAGGHAVGVVTVAERPTRIIVVAFTLLGAGAVADRAGEAATAGAVVLLGVTAVGFVQLAARVRRTLDR